ncbi:MAG: hypothetical protein V1706_12225 [Pseudomonadota bacterium]
MNQSQRNCAFCGTNENLTREHIFPNSILRSHEKRLLTINDKNDKVFKGDLVVKDVCKNCNGGILSYLDKELLGVYREFMHEPIAPGSSAKLVFDYNLLLRVLLKVSYNSARASSDGQRATAALKKLVPYIIGDNSVAPNVMLRLQIVTSANKYNIVTEKIEGTLDAVVLRNCKIDYDGPQSSSFVLRLVAINSYWFYIIISNSNINNQRKKSFLANFKNWIINPGVPINRNSSEIIIPREKTTYIHETLLEGMKRKIA